MVRFAIVAEHTLYHVIVFWVFFAVYRAIGFTAKNFSFHNNRSAQEENDLMTTLHYCVSTHAHMGANDVTPTSALSRAVTALHVITTFVLYAGILLLIPSQSGVGAGIVSAAAPAVLKP